MAAGALSVPSALGYALPLEYLSLLSLHANVVRSFFGFSTGDLTGCIELKYRFSCRQSRFVRVSSEMYSENKISILSMKQDVQPHIQVYYSLKHPIM